MSTFSEDTIGQEYGHRLQFVGSPVNAWIVPDDLASRIRSRSCASLPQQFVQDMLNGAIGTCRAYMPTALLAGVRVGFGDDSAGQVGQQVRLTDELQSRLIQRLAEILRKGEETAYSMRPQVADWRRQHRWRAEREQRERHGHGAVYYTRK